MFPAEQEGIDLYPVELKQFMRRIVTSIHENWFAVGCLNTTRPAGEGAIVMQTAVYVLVALYDGSIGSASRAAAADHFASQLKKSGISWYNKPLLMGTESNSSQHRFVLIRFQTLLSSNFMSESSVVQVMWIMFARHSGHTI
ncbi:hypothetical protein F2Q70_00028443 [Brassica cretica]|uniref:Uncharacterized protein n=2 Tax=Brassica cretica TaxID=69181 RepID=A0A3N6RLP3_BRACR|nr:hypothetical protein F2Q68_00028028 [Brassica cretica]KAF2603597.1 hypothetical protein F2Q70_00028443 [Brassica cretica]KAF3578397.1 hypothetical protein DY000_02035397 [Brassica cretica]